MYLIDFGMYFFVNIKSLTIKSDWIHVWRLKGSLHKLRMAFHPETHRHKSQSLDLEHIHVTQQTLEHA